MEPAEPSECHLGDEDLVYLLHIPRTGGTSLFELLASRFPAGSSHRGSDRDALAADLREASGGVTPPWRVISGHDTDVTALLGRAPHVVTMLREPIARTMSHYEMIKRRSDHPLHEEMRDLTFLEYLTHPRGGAVEADRQTRQIAGALRGDGAGADGAPQGTAFLDLARERLEEFAFFGLRERYDESIRLLAHTFGWPPVQRIPHLRSSGATNHRLRLGARELELARDLNRADLELYRFARSLFRDRVRELDALQESDERPSYAGA